RSVWGPPLAGALTAAVTAYVWLPFVLALESGLGFELAPGIAVCAAVAFSGFAPLLAVPRGQGRGRATLLAATVVALVVSGALAATSENFTEDRPQRLSLIYLQSAVDGAPQSAKWLLDACPPPVLAEELSQVARFVVDSPVRLPWNPPNLRSAQGPLLDAPSPGLTVLADERSAAGRVVTVRLSTPRL